jgi:hypothetical protein
MREYNRQYRIKHGISVAAAWRRDHPREAKKHREREKARWHRDPEVRRKHTEKGVEWRLSTKIETLDAYGGPICICCGEQHVAFLTLDHVDDNGAAHRRSLKKVPGGSRFYSYLKARGFPQEPRLQVMCWNCNCGRRINGGVCPHKSD